MSAKRITASFGLALFAAMFMGLSFFPNYVHASQAYLCGGFSRLNRPGCYGYFTGTNFYSTYGIQGQNILDCTKAPSSCVNGEAINNAIPAGVTSAPSFESLVQGYLGSGTSYDYNKAGAAFIVDGMLGRWGTDYGNTTAGIQYAQDNFGEWKNRVDYYSSQGWINWDWVTTLPAGTINSLHACWPSIPNCTTGNISSFDSRDFAFFRNPAAEFSNVIVFSNPNGTTFEIRRECGNLLGTIDGLSPIPSFNGSCAGMTIDPGRPDPHTPYTVTANVGYSSTANASLARSLDKFYLDVNGPSVSYNNGNIGTSQNGSTITASVGLGASNNTGSYTVSYGMSGPAGPAACSGSFVIADQPTTTIGGGDTESGVGMSSGGVDCAAPADDKAGLVGWNLGASNGYAGAGTQYAALALNHLQDFATAQGSGLVPTGLAFANTSDGGINIPSGLFGGQFGGMSCAPDYFAGATGVQNGNITVNTTAVANGTHTTLYVKGNVYISGPITYSGSYASVADIPSYSVIVEGNIYIAPGVSQLDGLYVAEPTVVGGVPSGGIIYTCTSAPFTAAPLNANLYSTCKTSPLTVNGSFVARQVWLLRTFGSDSGASSENFNFSPETWLSIPPASGSGNSTSGKYDAITSLPPVL